MTFKKLAYQKSDSRKLRKQLQTFHFENYNIEHVPTESANGVALLYIKKASNYKLRPDLMIYKKRELESVLLK